MGLSHYCKWEDPIKREVINIMSKTRKTYSAELKTKLVLEVIKEEKTLVEIASANKITPKNLQN